MKSGATETSYVYLQEHYKFPENVFVSHLPEQIKKSDHPYKILWAHHAYDQPLFLNFDHNIVQHIVSPSQWNKEQFIKYLNVPEHKITVIPNGVSDIFTHSSEKTKTMIFTSVPYKGLEVLLKIIPCILQRHPDTKFKIFSSMSLYGISDDAYNDLYDNLKSISNVEYSPAVEQEELVKHYQESAFFIHPNIWEETFCVSMCEAMRCGSYPIITNIGALSEIAGDRNASVVSIDGKNTSKGWEVTDQFINNFTEACCESLDIFDNNQNYYRQVSKNISDYIVKRYNWKNIATQWKELIENLFNQKMNIQNTALEYTPITAHQAVNDDEYLFRVFQNLLFWEESDKEMAQGRTNFQIEKFIALGTHSISVAFEHVLKERRSMAEGYMYKIIKMKEMVREFEYKWKDKDKSEPIIWDVLSEGGKKLCWYDLDELALVDYLKSSELEIRDRLHQMEHMDNILQKLIEKNGNKVPDRKQFLEENEEYWNKRLAEQALDDLMERMTGIKGDNIQAMRRASGPSIVDKRNQLKDEYLSLDKLLTPEGRDEYIKDLTSRVFDGYDKISDKQESKILEEKDKKEQGYFNFNQRYFSADQSFKEE